MDGLHPADRKKSLKERLGLTGIGCCGTKWRLRPTLISVRDDDDQEEENPQIELINVAQTPTIDELAPPCVGQSAAATGMNLAAALAAERQIRTALDSDDGGTVVSLSATRPSSYAESSPSISVTGGTVPPAALRVPLMRLLEETDGHDGEMRNEEKEGGEFDWACCVCMVRKKGAAFIPCGHTFCRACSRQIRLNRGCCPLCNRSILEILDIY